MKALVFQEKKSQLESSSGLEKIPAIETRSKSLRTPKRSFDFVLVTSVRAMKAFKKWPVANTYIAIGEKTATSLKSCPFPHKILSESTSTGVLSFFRKQKPSSIFFPRSARGNPETVHKLRQMGHKVFVRHSYETKLLDLRKRRAQIFSPKVEAFVFTSPSCFQALRQSFGLRALQNVHVQWVAIGPITGAYIRKHLKTKKLFVAKKPDFASLKTAVLTSRKKRTMSS